MALDYLILLFLTFCSIFANFLSAFSGGGAGLIQLPTLIFLGLSFPKALATHKLASVALGIGATFRHLKENSLQPKISLLIISFGIPGVLLGANTVLIISSKYSTLLLGILTLFVASFSLSSKLKEGGKKNPILTGWKLSLGCIVLFLIGFLNGSLASGSGLFVTLWLVRWFGISYKQSIVHTLILVGVIWNATGAITLGTISNVKWDWLPPLLFGSFIGGYIGAHFAILKDERIIKSSFEIIATIMGISLLAKGFSA